MAMAVALAQVERAPGNAWVLVLAMLGSPYASAAAGS
jgi:hypothetical protein